ncbi:hypothetical protein BDK51DRAFT_36696 [Blyttiomyces helicus]|uniref:Uncharacterized protein n=1 Tax=Blyttiomyces helicus TaxID=388810 RepID=A0A4P9WKW6_9FUNG|nr:hypothetical protein BDK51DRAFT_36696 [Blyttiomyces helicus]|eukprot:RKO93474.1 hypothetical protein BDK51DRAFT_36696 [Blyttiomyces helicus]
MTESMITAGGCGVAKSLTLGTNARVLGTALCQSSILTDISTSQSATNAGNVFNFFRNATITTVNFGVTTTNLANVFIAGAPITGLQQTATNSYSLWIESCKVLLSDTTDASGTSTVCLQLSGGLSVNRCLYVTNTITVEGNFNSNGTIASSGTALSTLFSNPTNSASLGIGSVPPLGGMSVVKSLRIGTLFDVLGISDFSAAGGSIAGGTTISGNLSVSGNSRFSNIAESSFLSSTNNTDAPTSTSG